MSPGGEPQHAITRIDQAVLPPVVRGPVVAVRRAVVLQDQTLPGVEKICPRHKESIHVMQRHLNAWCR